MAVNAQTYYALRQTITQAIENGNEDTITEETWQYILDQTDSLDAWYKLTGLLEAIKIADIGYDNGNSNGKVDNELSTTQARKAYNQKLLASQNGK